MEGAAEIEASRAERDETKSTDDTRDTPERARSNAVDTDAAETEDAGNAAAQSDESPAAQDIATVAKTVETAIETAVATPTSSRRRSESTRIRATR